MSSKESNGMVALSAGELMVRYFKVGDRLAHAIGIANGESFVPILESIEGNEHEPWPASPPMQEMVQESFAPNASPVLLGVGLSGNGHWSTAIEAKNGRQLKFDIACKNSKSASSFGSEYRIVAECAVVPGDEKTPEKLGLRLDSPSELATMEIAALIGRLDLSGPEKRIRIVPNSDPGSILTHRWCYEISLFS